MNTKVTLSILVAILLGGIIATFIFSRMEPTPLEFTDIQGISIISPPIPLDRVALTDSDGQAFPIERLENRWAMLFFGYTHCPDVCPTTLMSLKQSAKQLRLERPDQPEPAYVFVSLDPARDSPKVIKDYVSYFDPAFIGLTGEQDAIARLAETVGVIYDYEGDIDSGKYIVNHYAAILVVDPQLRLRAHILPPHPVDKITQAFTLIRDYYGN